MSYTILHSIPVKDAQKDHEIILWSFTEGENIWFQTVIRIVDTGGIILQTQPITNWKNSKNVFNHILEKSANFLELTPHQVYQLKKKRI